MNERRVNEETGEVLQWTEGEDSKTIVLRGVPVIYGRINGLGNLQKSGIERPGDDVNHDT